MGLSNTLFYLLTAYVRYRIDTGIEHTLLPTDCLCCCMYSVPYHNCIYSRLPDDEPSGSKREEDIKIKNTNLDNVDSDGLYCIILLQCMVQ